MDAAVRTDNRAASPGRQATKRIASRALLAGAALCSLGGLAVVVNPVSLGRALQGFDGRMLLPLAGLMVVFYLLQGLRWHLLLRNVGVTEGVVDNALVNLAGQTLSAVLPMGDLTRALLVSRRSRVEFGAAAATVTIQELTFTLLVVASAAPGLARLPQGVLLMVVVVTGIAAVIALLTVPRLFHMVRQAVGAAPGLRGFVGDIEVLHREVRRLLGRADVLAGSVLDLGRVITATASLLLVLRGLHIDWLSWWDVALVLAASFVGGALSLLPGGVGANEASVVGVLVLFGVNPAAAAAAAIVQRLSLTLVPSAGGALAYLALRWRDHEALAVGSTRARATGRRQRTLDVPMCRLQPVDQN
jgi:uncharacterized membrane protein YbhN (UPF0104 family)